MQTETSLPKNCHPLSKAELPSAVQPAYDLDSQRLEAWAGRRSKVLTIQRCCLTCKENERVRVTTVREAIKIGTLSGECRPCVAKKKGRAQPTGSTAYNWKGGRRLSAECYVMVRCPKHPAAQNGYVQEHRLVMEQFIKRCLLKGETVHHKNGDRADNAIENLELFSCNHGNGQRYDDMSATEIKMLIEHLQQLLEAKLA